MLLFLFCYCKTIIDGFQTNFARLTKWYGDCLELSVKTVVHLHSRVRIPYLANLFNPYLFIV